MNVIILAGGYAERLWPLTEELPKVLLSVSGKPILFHLLENISRIPGVSSITIAIDKNKEDYFRLYIDSLNIFSTVRPHFSPHKPDDKGEIKGALHKVQEILCAPKDHGLIGDDFLLVGGDNVFGFSLDAFINFYRDNYVNCIAIQKSLEQIDASQFGCPTLDSSGRLTTLDEKPKAQQYRLVSTACYCLKRSDIEKVSSYLSLKKEDNLGHFMDWLARQTKIMGYQFEAPWYDTGTREGILAANALIMKNNQEAIKSPEWIYGNTTIIPPVHVESKTTIQDSSIGPYAYICEGTTLVQSRVENSIVYPGCRISGCTVRNSVIGPESALMGDINEAVIGPKTKLDVRQDQRYR